MISLKIKWRIYSYTLPSSTKNNKKEGIGKLNLLKKLFKKKSTKKKYIVPIKRNEHGLIVCKCRIIEATNAENAMLLAKAKYEHKGYIIDPGYKDYRVVREN